MQTPEFFAETSADVGALHAGTVEAGLALALEVEGLEDEDAVGVRVTVLLTFSHRLAWVDALSLVFLRVKEGR